MELRTTNLNWNGQSNVELCLAIDMDEVLADTLGKQLNNYNRRYGTHVVAADLHGTELAEIVPREHRPWVLDMLHEPGFFCTAEYGRPHCTPRTHASISSATAPAEIGRAHV